MRNHELTATPETKAHLPQQVAEQPMAAATAHAVRSPQYDPLAGLLSRFGDPGNATAHASALNRATAARPSRAGHFVLQLQRHYGNQYVQRVLSIARQADGEAEAGPEIEQSIQQARGGGQALDSGVRVQMESAFGAEFSGVRVHTGTQADTLNQALSARAFTTGHDIFFRQGEYSPGSSGGRELLAHELTHVVQQTDRGVHAKLTVGQPGDRYEREADEMATRVMRILEPRTPVETTISRQTQNTSLNRSGSDQDTQAGKEVAHPHLTVKSFSWVPPTSDEKTRTPLTRLKPDKSINEESEMQDQNASVTTLVATANGVRIEVEAQGVYTSSEYPEGFKWTQTIDTNVPKGGTTSPYVDPRPNDDTKPFYYTDAEQVSFPTTFHDGPSRPAPATGTTNWDAILGLNGVNETTKAVKGFDYLTYGFSIDSAGKVTVRGPASIGGGGHRAILASEFSGWTFS